LASIVINKENPKKYHKTNQNEENEGNEEKGNYKDDDNKEIQEYLEKDQKNENKEKKISKWSKDEIVVAILTLLAGVNVEVLTILESKIQIFGLNFNTELSPSALKVISWGAWFNLLAEDIPQIIIQVLYIIVYITYHFALINFIFFIFFFLTELVF